MRSRPRDATPRSIAAPTLLAFQRDVRLLPWAAALKFGPLLAGVATPTLWVQRLTVLLATPRAGGRDDRSTDDE